MLDIKIIRENPDTVRQAIARRRMDPQRVDVDKLIALDEKWRELQGQAEAMRAERNAASQSIKKLTGDERNTAIATVKALKDKLASAEAAAEGIKGERDQLLADMPNLLAADVPDGGDDESNVEISRWGEPRRFDFPARDHVEIGELTDTIDFDGGAKVAGSNFYFLKREAALLEQALCIFAARELLPAGYQVMSTPDLARDQILSGIGFQPRGPETQVYSVENSDLSLIGTAEIALGGYHADTIIDGSKLPLRYLGFSHCFRTEAGAYGKESRGLYRVHQFTKAEMFIYCSTEQSAEMHEEIRAHEERLLQKLELPYRVVNVCAGDLGAPAYKKYDIEAWMPGRNAYGEVTSCSNCTDYQARRLNIRYRPDAKAAPRPLHMLNGTAIAVSRTLIAILENYQQADGSVRIPDVLQPLVGAQTIPLR
ncbi:MAG: serine--tRNA ligase [Deltaproteobacteria bacterium]|nr:serine--tRNA ligase [Deltaproteobacteria bacterium]